MKRIVRGIVGTLSVVTFAIALTKGVGADTGVYIGKDVSSEGCTVIAGNADSNPGEGVYVTIVDRQNHKKGDLLLGKGNDFEYEYPDTTYEYRIIRNMDYVKNSSSYTATNEYGVCISALASADNNMSADYADPNLLDGIGRADVADVIASSCKTARSATNLLCQIIDNAGAADTFVVLIADQREVWYMEVYSGHQYAAMKMPNDMVAVYSDEFMLGGVDSDDESMIFSEDLFTLPEEGDFAEYDADGRLNLAKTYGDQKSMYNTARTWVGHETLAPSDRLDYDEEGYYSLLFEPDGKVSVEDVFALLRNRYEDADFTNKLEDGEILASISNDTTCASTVVQIYGDLPAEISNVTWLCAGPTAFAPYVPVLGYSLSVDESYGTNLDQDEYVEGVAACEYQVLNAMCSRDINGIGAPIKEYWEGAESLYVRKVSEVMHNKLLDAYEEDPDSARDLAENTSTQIMRECVQKAKELFNEGIWHETKNYGSVTRILDGKVYNANCNSKEYEPYFDVVEYAIEMGWEVQNTENVLTCTRNDEIIVIELDGENSSIRKYNGDGSEEVLEIEDVEQEIANASLNDKKKTESLKNETDKVAEYFDKKVRNIPRDGWTEEEALEEIENMKNELVKLVETYFGKNIDEIDLKDIESLADIKSVGKYANNMDVEKTANIIGNITEGAGKVISEYFGISEENIRAILSKDGINREEAETLVNGINEDIHALLAEYVRKEFRGLIDENLTTDEIYALLEESGSEIARIANEYMGIYISDWGEISIDDIVDGLDSLDPSTKKALGELFDVDVDAVIDAYRDGELEVDIDINVDAEELGLSDEYIDKLEAYFASDKKSLEQESLNGDELDKNELDVDEIKTGADKTGADKIDTDEIDLEKTDIEENIEKAEPVVEEPVVEEPVVLPDVEAGEVNVQRPLEQESITVVVPQSEVAENIAVEATEVIEKIEENGTGEESAQEINEAVVAAIEDIMNSEDKVTDSIGTVEDDDTIEILEEREIIESLTDSNGEVQNIELKNVNIRKVGRKYYAPGYLMRLFR